MMAGAKIINQKQPKSADEDDAAKKNTDCVYFLASPLTCKKGSECEYRHSEHARVNPRDCWYWLNGSCLNPKCAFRHPPLDGLVGSQSAVSAGTAFPLPQAAIPSPFAAHQPKQPVPCIFFQKGLCLKGDKCAFLHGPDSITKKHPQVAPPATEITGPKSVFGIPQRSAPEPKLYQPNVSNSNKFTDVKPNLKMSNAPPKSEAVKRVVLPSRGFNDRSPSNIPTTITPPSNDMHQVEVPEDYIMRNGNDTDDLYRESSPGFDVLVDDELGEDQYYDADQYSTRGDHDGRNVDDDLEMFHDPQGYDVHDGVASHQAQYQNRRSSDRASRGTDSLERWSDRNGGSFERTGKSDLRNRLKLKKESGLRSVVSNDYAHDNHERWYGDSRRESRPVAPLESSLSCLEGRIKDPRRSPMRGTVSGRDFEMGRNLSRTSPVRTQMRDRIGSRVQNDFGSERNLRGRGEFSGPKRLSDLKPCKSSIKDRLISGQESFSLGKRKNSRKNEQLYSDLSFEGPKPLSEILKRKKKSEVNPPVREPSENKETNKTESAENTDINKEANTSVTDASEEKIELDNLHPSEETKTNHNEQEEGILAGEEMEDQNLEEGYEQGEDGEEYYYYEEDEVEYTVEEGETAEGGDVEYVEEEDGDAIEKKIDGTFS